MTEFHPTTCRTLAESVLNGLAQSIDLLAKRQGREYAGINNNVRGSVDAAFEKGM